MAHCVYCLTELRTGASKCHACGEWIEEIDGKPIKIVKPSSNNELDIDDKNKKLVIGIVVSVSLLMFFGALFGSIWYFKDEILAAIPEKDAYQYNCDVSEELQNEFNKKLSILCEKNSPFVKIQYKEKDLLVIDGEKLLLKCGHDKICDKDNSIHINESAGTGGYIIENNSITKSPSLYALAFINKPNDAEKIQTLKNIFELHTLNFGDSVYIHILGTSEEPLVLNYKIPSLSLEVFNKEKNHEKTIILGLSKVTEVDDEFSYEQKLSFYSKSQFETQLTTYLTGVKSEYRESVTFFDYINDEITKLKDEKFEQKYFSFYINAIPKFPTIGYGRSLDEYGCNSWKDMAIRYNKDIDYRYNQCLNSENTGCRKGTKISGDYSYSYLSKITNLYPDVPKGNSIAFIDIPGYNIDEIGNIACKSEIQDALLKIKSNLVTSSNP